MFKKLSAAILIGLTAAQWSQPAFEMSDMTAAFRDVANSIPLRKHEVQITKTANKQARYLPMDIERRYDEAVFRIY